MSKISVGERVFPETQDPGVLTFLARKVPGVPTKSDREAESF